MADNTVLEAKFNTLAVRQRDLRNALLHEFAASADALEVLP